MLDVATPVEARSLSSITSLASNPPTYPRNPTHEVHEPLTLYIVRVPGSKDVFLSPLKPPTKASISAEAIQASLYYLHVTTPEDESVRESLEEEKRSAEAENPSPSLQIHRKPLPTEPFSNETPADRPQLPPKSYPDFQPPPPENLEDTQAARRAARGTHIRLDTATASEGTTRRKPLLGPRPMHSKGVSVDTDAMGKSEGDVREVNVQGRPRARTNPSPISPSIDFGGWRAMNLEANGARNSVDRAELRNLKMTRYNQFNDPTGTAGSKPPPGIPPPLPVRPGDDPRRRSADNDFHITVIRRDPASGSQWNIGTIYTNNAEDPTAVTVEITTPSYQRFARNKPLELPANFDLTSLSKRNGDAAAQLSNLAESSPDSASSGSAPFIRQIRLTDPRSHRPGSSSGSPTKTSISPIKARNMQYSFTSPWNGTCTFITGMNGRSLKCRHTLPSTSATSHQVNTIAELRFNLPWAGPGNPSTTLRNRDANTNGIGHRGGSLTKVFNSETKANFKAQMQKIKDKSLNRDEDSSGLPLSWRPPQGHSRDEQISDDDDSEEDGRLDLTLGRERAGGGRTGKSAKLGKLIIEDEGLKMCDLAVAGCMAVYWKYYSGMGRKVGF